jgi:hypothetical protein
MARRVLLRRRGFDRSFASLARFFGCKRCKMTARVSTTSPNLRARLRKPNNVRALVRAAISTSVIGVDCGGVGQFVRGPMEHEQTYAGRATPPSVMLSTGFAIFCYIREPKRCLQTLCSLSCLAACIAPTGTVSDRREIIGRCPCEVRWKFSE